METATSEKASNETSSQGKGVKKTRKYTKYNNEQIAILEKLYAQCRYPSLSQLSQLVLDHAALKDLQTKNLKSWFQSQRVREMKDELQKKNQRLPAVNKLLQQNAKCLETNVGQLASYKTNWQNQWSTLTATTAGVENEHGAASPQLSVSTAANKRSLLLLAEETKTEFLSKATGTAFNWVEVPGFKFPNPNTSGFLYVSHDCIGVAARACTVLPFNPIKIIEIVKSCPTWYRDCRNLKVLEKIPAHNGGEIELIYTQFYAPTILATARDFWTVRYTSRSTDGSFVVCEKSVSGKDAASGSTVTVEFDRARMLASGYLITPYEGGRSCVTIINHLDLQASSVLEVLRPLYKSPKLVAEKMIVSALYYFDHLANGDNGEERRAYRPNPDALRSFSQRLGRGFNDAINSFHEDGWSSVSTDAGHDLNISVKGANNLGLDINYDRILCVKTFIIFQNVLPAKLMRILRERRSDWMDCNAASLIKTGSYVFPGSNTHNLSEKGMLLGPTAYKDEIMEMFRFKCHTEWLKEIYHLQMCNGMEDIGGGACSELIFAPFAQTIPDGAILLSSGFRIFSLDPNTDAHSAKGTSKAASCSNVHAAASDLVVDSSNYPGSLLILAFQFPFETHFQEGVLTMARQYVLHVISSVKKISLSVTPSGSDTALNSTDAIPALTITPTMDTAIISSEEIQAQALTPPGTYTTTKDVTEAIPTLTATPSQTDAEMNFTEAIPPLEVIPSQMDNATSSTEAIPALTVMPSGMDTAINSAEAIPAAGLNISADVNADNLVNWICESYRSSFGVALLDIDFHGGPSLLEGIWNYQDAIICCSSSPNPVCMFANQAGLNMLQTTIENLQAVTLNTIFGNTSNVELSSVIPTLKQEGHCIIPFGFFSSPTNHYISFDKVVAWRVHDQEGYICGLAFLFVDWWFVS